MIQTAHWYLRRFEKSHKTDTFCNKPCLAREKNWTHHREKPVVMCPLFFLMWSKRRHTPLVDSKRLCQNRADLVCHSVKAKIVWMASVVCAGFVIFTLEQRLAIYEIDVFPVGQRCLGSQYFIGRGFCAWTVSITPVTAVAISQVTVSGAPSVMARYTLS